MASRASLLPVNIFSRLLNSPACSRLTGQQHLQATLTFCTSSAVPGDEQSHRGCVYEPSSSSAHHSSTSSTTSGLLNSPHGFLLSLCGSRGCVSNSLLNPQQQPVGSLGQRRFYQAALKPRLICPGCYFVWRHGRKHVECSDHPRHKQMKRVAKRKMWKEDYTSGDWAKALDFHKVHYRRFDRNVDRTTMSYNWVAGKLGTEL